MPDGLRRRSHLLKEYVINSTKAAAAAAATAASVAEHPDEGGTADPTAVAASAALSAVDAAGGAAAPAARPEPIGGRGEVDLRGIDLGLIGGGVGARSSSSGRLGSSGQLGSHSHLGSSGRIGSSGQLGSSGLTAKGTHGVRVGLGQHSHSLGHHSHSLGHHSHALAHGEGDHSGEHAAKKGYHVTGRCGAGGCKTCHPAAKPRAAAAPQAQSEAGLQGQAHACWHHVITPAESRCIRVAGFPVLVAHGQLDRIAHVSHARHAGPFPYPPRARRPPPLLFFAYASPPFISLVPFPGAGGARPSGPHCSRVSRQAMRDEW